MAILLKMLFPEGRAKVFTTSYDDGMTGDRHLAELMRKYGIRGTFNINSGRFTPEDFVDPPVFRRRRMKKSEMLAFYKDFKDIIELAGHGVTHPKFTAIPSYSAAWEAVQDRHNIEEIFGVICRGFANPNGAITDEAVEALRACGIVYDRGTQREGFDLPKDWLRFGGTCHHTVPELLDLGREFLALPEAKLRDGAKWFYVWGHTYEFDDNGDWDKIEELFRIVGGKKEVWYATNIEIYDYVKAYEALQFSVDCRIVKNPSALPVWFAVYSNTTTEERRVVRVDPGEMKEVRPKN